MDFRWQPIGNTTNWLVPNPSHFVYMLEAMNGTAIGPENSSKGPKGEHAQANSESESSLECMHFQQRLQKRRERNRLFMKKSRAAKKSEKMKLEKERMAAEQLKQKHMRLSSISFGMVRTNNIFHGEFIKKIDMARKCDNYADIGALINKATHLVHCVKTSMARDTKLGHPMKETWTLQVSIFCACDSCIEVFEFYLINNTSFRHS